jgi:dTDP-4-dehydrorhamnose 3,5-epimerase
MKFAQHSHTPEGETYFSVISPGMIKAWHLHEEMELNYACIYGKILLVLFDVRAASPTHKELMEIYLSPEDYKLVHIPVGIMNGVKGLAMTDNIVANSASIVHNETEIKRFPIEYVKRYDWFKRGA